MKKVYVLVEGQTEEQFLGDVLSPYLEQKDIFIRPILINTKVVKSGPNFRGGINSYQQIKKDLHKLLTDSTTNCVTTMIDYYGLPADFPEFHKDGSSIEKVANAETAFSKDIGHSKFLPYLQLHEFEALLFAAPEILSKTLDTTGRSEIRVKRIRQSFTSPEEINDSPSTCPSRRIKDLYEKYNKPFYGTLIASRIGIDQIVQQCPHFSNWVKNIENC